MIRQLTEVDRTAVLNYLYQDQHYNIFPIGDIESFGFDTDFQTVYGEFDQQNQYMSIFLKYRSNGIYYSHMKHFNDAYLPIIKQCRLSFISGKSELMDLINPHLHDFERHREYFCRAQIKTIPSIKHKDVIKRATSREDCGKIFDLLNDIDEFSSMFSHRENYIDGKMKSLEMGVTLFIEKEGKAIATLATTAETTVNAMVISVATDKQYRNRGYATMLLQELMRIYFEEKHKELCLFYDNPSAGRIYLRLGFENIGMWDFYRRIK